jgi:hypothetical protein
MADNRRQYDLTIDVLGRLDPSLIQTINETEARLKELGASTKTQNAFMGQVYKEAFSGMGASAKKEFEEATKQASKFNDFMANVKSTFTGVFAADIASKFFDTAKAGAQELVEKMKEASNLSANMELQRTQFAMENKLTPEQMKSMETFFTQRSVAIPITKQAQYEGAKIVSTGIQETDPDKKMALIIKETEMIQDLAALSVHTSGSQNPVAALNEQYTSLALIISNMQKYGVSLENTIKPLEQAGLNIRPQLLLNQGAITQDQYAHWSSMPAEERDEILGGLAKERRFGMPTSLAVRLMAQRIQFLKQPLVSNRPLLTCTSISCPKLG